MPHGVVAAGALGGHGKGTAPLGDVPPGQHANHPGQGRGCRHVDMANPGMRVRTPENGCVVQIGHRLQIGNVLGLEVKDTLAFGINRGQRGSRIHIIFPF